MKALLVTASFLVGCGPQIVSTCRYGTIEILGEKELDCAAVSESMDVMRVLMEDGPYAAFDLDPETGYSFLEVWPDPSPVDRWGGFDAAFDGMVVVVEDSDTIRCGSKDVGGCSINSHIYLACTTQDFLVHESLHYLQCKAGDCWNSEHTGWAENGYRNMGDSFHSFGPGVVWCPP